MNDLPSRLGGTSKHGPLVSLLPPLHPAGFPFVAGGLAAGLVVLFIWWPLGLLALAFGGFSLYFFRDPIRVPPKGRD